MLNNRRVDLQRQSQCCTTFFERNLRSPSSAHCIEKRLDLGPQRLPPLDFWLLDSDTWSRAEGCWRHLTSQQGGRGVLVDANADYVLPPVIDRDVLVRVKK